MITLPALLSPSEAVLLRSTLLAALNDGEAKIVLDGSAVQDVSIQGLSVLLAFIHSASERHRAWALKAPSEDLIAALETYGLFSHLMTWPVEI